MTDLEQNKALIVLGCPEVPVQNSLAIYAAYQLKKAGYNVLIAGNPAVMKLLMTADPERHYIPVMTTLEKLIEDISAGDTGYDLCLSFAHSDAGIAYAATIHYLLPKTRFVTIVFGRQAEEIANLIDYGGEQIVEIAVHDPMQLKKKMNEVFNWAVLKN